MCFFKVGGLGGIILFRCVCVVCLWCWINEGFGEMFFGVGEKCVDRSFGVFWM